MDTLLNVATLPIITFIVYQIINIAKQAFNYNENFLRFTPLVASVLGLILGLVIYFVFPSVYIAENALFALIIGMASGLAATGSNQVIKQLKKYGEDNHN